MFEKYMICEQGFKNVSQDGRITGFQLNVKITYYRGIPLSCIEDFAVTVDGEAFKHEQVSFTTGTHTYPLNELEKVTDVRWPWAEPATLTISKPGGLVPGEHEVQVVETLRISYMAALSVCSFKQKMTLVA